MTPHCMDEADREIRRIGRQRHWQRVRWFVGLLSTGFFAIWLLVEIGIWLAARLRGWL